MKYKDLLERIQKLEKDVEILKAKQSETHIHYHYSTPSYNLPSVWSQPGYNQRIEYPYQQWAGGSVIISSSK